ncbi:MAG: class I SAM-dependent methyltransferase [Myxococcota bacterium]
MSETNRQSLTVTEALTRFHDRYAGGSGVVFGNALRSDGRSTYAALAAHAGGAVLDLACGDGSLTAAVLARGIPTVTGLDQNRTELAQARARFPELAFVEGDARDLPFPDGAFDTVLCHMALMLIPDGDRVAAEVRRVLRPGGGFAGVVGDGLDTTNPVVPALMPAINTVVAEAGLHIDYPGERWTDAEVAGRFPGWAATSEVAVLEQHVPLERFAHFVTLHYYGVGLLDGAFADHARELALEVGRAHAVDGRVRWTTRTRAFSLRAPA